MNDLYFRCLYLIPMLMMLLGTPTEAEGQTCRIRCGVNSAGVQTYKEVFEYDYVTNKPEFPGGDDKFMCFINRQRRYPARAYKDGIEGRVICSFVINTDGAVSNVEILKGVEASLNAEALRILNNMPDWTPGKIDGKAVPVRVIRPIPFRR